MPLLPLDPRRIQFTPTKSKRFYYSSFQNHPPSHTSRCPAMPGQAGGRKLKAAATAPVLPVAAHELPHYWARVAGM